jgi:hypothetical protein
MLIRVPCRRCNHSVRFDRARRLCIFTILCVCGGRELLGSCDPFFLLFDRYESCMDVTDSDHKPVRCTFSVDIARVDELIRRQEFGKIIESNKKVRSLLRELRSVPDTVVNANNITLENHQEDVILRITNNCETSKAAFEILCEGQTVRKQGGTQSEELLPRACFVFPLWLEFCQ